VHLSELVGRRVVSRATAETLGDVHDLYISIEPPSVTALQLGKGRKAGAVAWPKIVGIGPDAVVVADDDAVTEHPDEVSPMGRLLLSELGNAAGTVSDVEFDDTSGSLIAVSSATATITGDRLMADGPYAIIVAARQDDPFPG
jgi:uncharacterized protein YrrD